MRRVVFSSVLFVVMLPHVSVASVFISEVAWMGSVGDANAEWIELYNNGEDADLSGWTLSAMDGQPNILLSGVLNSGSHALFERSDDDTVPNVPAFLTYTGSLANTGELLELRNANGVRVDYVDGSDSWGIGGNNDTKETLQRTGNPPVGGWTTGVPNPKSSIPGEVAGASDERQSDTTGTSSGNVITGAPKHDEPKRYPALELDLGGERIVSVGSPVVFLARGYGEGGKELTSFSVMWNFGDGSVAFGREAEHVFRYPGDYLVTATGNRESFLEDVKDEKSIIVHVAYPAIRISESTHSYIALKNTSNGTVDISGFVLVSEENHFKIPQGTSILAGAEVRFPKQVTGLTARQVSLYDTFGIAVSEFGAMPEPAAVSGAQTQHTPAGTVLAVNTVTTPAEKVVIQSVPETSSELLSAVPTYDDSRREAEKQSPLLWWIFGLITAIVTAIVAVMLIRREQAEVIEGFYIEAEKSANELDNEYK